MGDRALPRVNRHVAARKQNYEYQLHRRNVSTKKHTVNTVAPKVHTHLASQMKRKQLEAERMSRVERENLHLLEKMRRIMVEPQTVVEPPYQKGSLNREFRRRSMIKIMNENEALLRRIQTRPSNYSVKKWENDYSDKEKLLYNISEFPYQSNHPSASARRRLIRNKKRPQSTPNTRRVKAPERTCVFSRGDLDIDGVNSIVSVYEISDPFRLEVIALDENQLSNKRPLPMKFSDLRLKFKSRPDLLKPENTDSLVLELLKLLHYGPDPKNEDHIQLQWRPEKPTSGRRTKGGKKGKSSKPKSARKETPPKDVGEVDVGEVMPVDLRVACRGLAGGDACKLALAIKNVNASAYSAVGSTEESGDENPIYKKKFAVDSYEKVDRELRVQVIGSGGVVGEATVTLGMFLALPNGKVELKLLDSNGKSNGGVVLLSTGDQEPAPAKAPSRPASAKKQPLDVGNMTIDGHEFTYSVADSGSERTFSLKHDKSSKTFDIAVPASGEPKAQLALFSAVGKDDSLQVLFGKKETVTVSCSDLQKEGGSAVEPLVRVTIGDALVAETEKGNSNDPTFNKAITVVVGQSYTFSLYDVAGASITDDDLVGVVTLQGDELTEVVSGSGSVTCKFAGPTGESIAKSTMTIQRKSQASDYASGDENYSEDEA